MATTDAVARSFRPPSLPSICHTDFCACRYAFPNPQPTDCFRSQYNREHPNFEQSACPHLEHQHPRNQQTNRRRHKILHSNRTSRIWERLERSKLWLLELLVFLRLLNPYSGCRQGGGGGREEMRKMKESHKPGWR